MRLGIRLKQTGSAFAPRSLAPCGDVEVHDLHSGETIEGVSSLAIEYRADQSTIVKIEIHFPRECVTAGPCHCGGSHE